MALRLEMKKFVETLRKQTAADWRYQTSKNHINCGVIQGFPALTKAVTSHVKKIFSRVLI